MRLGGSAVSAYIVNRQTIDALVSLAFDGPADVRPVSPDAVWYARSYLETDRDGTGQLLIDENVRSVRYRYPDSGEDLPGPLFHYWAADPYTYTRPARRPNVVEGLKLCDGFSYQACECPDYRDTRAGELVERIRSALIHCLPGYDAAPWADWPPEPSIEALERDAADAEGLTV